MKKRYILVLSAGLGIGVLLRFLNLLYFHTLEIDEAIYAQVIFAMTKGYIPYKDVVFVHPPVYLYIEYFVMLVNPNLLALRSFNVLLGIATICLIFYIGTLAFSKKTAFIASGIYALYPLAIYSNKIALVDNGLTFFTTLMMLLFVKYLKGKKVKYLVLSGMFAGISFMTKYSALLVIGALVLFSMFTFFRGKIIDLLIYIISTLIFPLAMFFLLLLTNIWPFFFVQTIQWQIIRFGMFADEKLWFFIQIVLSLSPLIVPVLFTTTRNIRDKNWQLIMAWFFVPLATFPFSKVVFLQYGFSLVPPLSILAARGVDRYIPNDFSFTRSMRKILQLRLIMKKIVPLTTITLVIISIFVIFLFSTPFAHNIRWVLFEGVIGSKSSAMLMQNQMNLGDYVKNLTTPNDKIWTSDASIAFFAERIIVEPNSEYWKLQGFFQDVWGYGWTKDDYRGPIKGYPTGLISIHDIQSAWEEEKPKVIVIIRTSLVDYFIWHGIDNPYHFEQGLANYIESHYHLENTFDMQNIEVWVRDQSAPD